MVGRSLRLCTAISTVLSSKARWISLVNRPIPPIAARGDSRSRSPCVLISTSEISSPGWARRSWSATQVACHRARWLPRVPIRIDEGRVSSKANAPLQARATTTAITRAAPAFFKARAAALQVAPVVRMSSTSKIVRPASPGLGRCGRISPASSPARPGSTRPAWGCARYASSRRPSANSGGRPRRPQGLRPGYIRGPAASASGAGRPPRPRAAIGRWPPAAPPAQRRPPTSPATRRPASSSAGKARGSAPHKDPAPPPRQIPGDATGTASTRPSSTQTARWVGHIEGMPATSPREVHRNNPGKTADRPSPSRTSRTNEDTRDPARPGQSPTPIPGESPASAASSSPFPSSLEVVGKSSTTRGGPVKGAATVLSSSASKTGTSLKIYSGSRSQGERGIGLANGFWHFRRAGYYRPSSCESKTAGK